MFNTMLRRPPRLTTGIAALLITALFAASAHAQLAFPPKLEGDRQVVTEQSARMLEPGDNLLDGVVIASTPPAIDFFYFPGQDYPGNPWSNWGDALFSEGKFYTSIGDHLHPRGTALLIEYDPDARKARVLANIRRLLETGDATHDPAVRVERSQDVHRSSGSLLHEDENYTPGKIHSRIDLGSDGWLYYATHRGSARSTTDAFGFRGDWILRTHPATGRTENAAAYPLAKHCMPASVLDAKRMIFYAGTAHGRDAQQQGVHLVAYDVANRQLVTAVAGGFDRYAILDPDTGRLFFNGKVYDPETRTISDMPQVPHVRSATRATADGWVYGTSGRDATIWGFNVRSGELRTVGQGAVASATYITSVAIDPAGRYLYYVPGAHGRGLQDNSPIVQYDLQTNTRKVLAFTARYFRETHGYAPTGTFGIALDDKGERLLVTWNGRRDPNTRAWDTCAGMLVHIPASERP